MDKIKVSKFFRYRKGARYGVYFLVALMAFAILGFFVLPPVLKSVLIDQASKALHRSVVVQQVRINPFSLTLDVDGLSIKERESEEVFFGFDNLHLNLDSASLFKGGLVVGEVRLVNPRVSVVRFSDQRYNFSDLLETPEQKQSSPARAPLFSVSNIQLSGGQVFFDDRPKHEQHEVRRLEISLPFISNMAFALDTFVEPSFSAQIDGAQVHAVGKSKPFSDSLESELSFDLNDLELKQYVPYAPVKLPVQFRSGLLDSALKLSFRQDKARAPAVHLSGAAAIRNLDIRGQDGGALIALKRFDLALESGDLMARRLAVGRVVLDSPDVNVRIDDKGRLNWADIIPDAAETSSSSEETAPLDWSVGEFLVTGGVLRVQDDSRRLPFKGLVDTLDFRLQKLSSRTSEPAGLSSHFRFNRRGEIAVEGTVSPMDVGADLNLSIKTLELLPFQSYFAERLNVAVTRGQLTADGVIHLRKPEGAHSGVDGRLIGQATLGDFQAVDKINSADFLRWKSLYFGKIDVNLNPMSIAVGEISLADFFARIIVSPEGKLNLSQMVRQDEASAALDSPLAKTPPSSEGKASVAVQQKKPSEPSPTPIRIGKITLQGGDIRFSDNFVKPNYTANLRKLGGRISGLSSEPGTVADLALRGRYDDSAPLTIDAKINPLSSTPYLDLQAEVKGIEMTSFSSYAGKYAGYAIDKGKLSLFVNYKIANGQLEAENRVFLDQLTFGNAVDSPDATKLPVRLAVSLLKNRHGEIDLNLPISGSLDDPQFSVGGLVVKVLVNLVVKAVASPFALLGSLFGGEELSMIEFDAGRAKLSSTAEQKLEKLAKALIDRPGLKLEIATFVDPEKEQEGLKRAAIERKVKAIKREDLTRKGLESGSVETIEISVEEYPALLERVYRSEKFPKPRNVVGLVKSISVEEMEKLLLTYEVIDDESLRDLGDSRAKRVRDWLVDHQVPLERVFLLPAKVAEVADKSADEDKTPRSQVVFSLK